MKRIKIYTDGACSGNPGVGGWGSIIQYNDDEKQLSGFEIQTTNNRMEITAAIEAIKDVLNNIDSPCVIEIFSDSQYLINSMNSWLYDWEKNNWKTAAKKNVENQDLWIILSNLSKLCKAKSHKIEWNWIRGHSGHIENERADFLARSAIIQNKNKL